MSKSPQPSWTPWLVSRSPASGPGGRLDRRDEILGVLLELLLVVGLQEGERGVGGDERLAALGVDGVPERRLGGERLL